MSWSCPNPALILKPGEDFACAAINKNWEQAVQVIHTRPYWEALSEHYDMPIDTLPWVETERDRHRVRFGLTPVSTRSDETGSRSRLCCGNGNDAVQPYRVHPQIAVSRRRRRARLRRDPIGADVAFAADIVQL